MQVLILNQDRAAQAEQSAALGVKGFSVICADTVAAALSEIRKGGIDVLVAAERVQGRLSHSVALSGECRNPWMATILLTDRTDPDVDELFDLLPSVHAILGHGVEATAIARLAFTSVTASIRARAPIMLQDAIEAPSFASRRPAIERPDMAPAMMDLPDFEQPLYGPPERETREVA